MNTAHMIIFGIAAVPVVLALLLRVNSVLLFLSVASGYLLQQTLGESAVLAVSSFTKSSSSDVIANLGLLWLPVVLTLLIARRTMKHASVLFQLLPLVLAGSAAAALSLPLLTKGFQDSVYSGAIGSQISGVSDLVVAGAAILNVLLAWRLYRNHDEPRHHGKH